MPAAGACCRGRAGSSGIVDADRAPPPAAEVAAAHERLSTSPESRFVRTATVQRRHARGVDILRARWLSRVERPGTRTELLADEAEWFATLADVFDLELPDVDAPERRTLWERVCAQHDAWAAQPGRMTGPRYSPPPCPRTRRRSSTRPSARSSTRCRRSRR